MPPKEQDWLLPTVLFFQILFQLKRGANDLSKNLSAWIGQNCNRGYKLTLRWFAKIRQPGW